MPGQEGLSTSFHRGHHVMHGGHGSHHARHGVRRHHGRHGKHGARRQRGWHGDLLQQHAEQDDGRQHHVEQDGELLQHVGWDGSRSLVGRQRRERFHGGRRQPLHLPRPKSPVIGSNIFNLAHLLPILFIID